MINYKQEWVGGQEDKQNLMWVGNTEIIGRGGVNKEKWLDRQGDSQAQSSDSDMDECFSMVERQFKRIGLKKLIGGTLRVRRQRDVNEGKIQICQEHLIFKAFCAWRDLMKRSRKCKAEAEALLQTKAYELQKKCFQSWVDRIKKIKGELLQRKRQIFQAFRIICSVELSIRVKRLRVMERLTQRRGQQLLQLMRIEKQESEQKYEKADSYRERVIKQRVIAAVKSYWKSESSSRLRFQKYELSFLYRKKMLLAKVFQALKSEHITKEQ